MSNLLQWKILYGDLEGFSFIGDMKMLVSGLRTGVTYRTDTDWYL